MSKVVVINERTLSFWTHIPEASIGLLSNRANRNFERSLAFQEYEVGTGNVYSILQRLISAVAEAYFQHYAGWLKESNAMDITDLIVGERVSVAGQIGRTFITRLDNAGFYSFVHIERVTGSGDIVASWEGRWIDIRNELKSSDFKGNFYIVTLEDLRNSAHSFARHFVTEAANA